MEESRTVIHSNNFVVRGKAGRNAAADDDDVG